MFQRALCVSAFVLLFALGFAVPASAQSNDGRILGTVTDSQGKVVVGAKIAITNTGTGTTRNLESNGAGDYIAPALQPGLYTVTAEARGFKKVEHSNIRLEVGNDVRVDIQLVPGAVDETIQVTGRSAADHHNERHNRRLAFKQRNQRPAVERPRLPKSHCAAAGSRPISGGGFESIVANGMRPEDNNFVVDGSDDNDPYYSGNIINAEGVQGTPGSILPIDAIQEFNTEENPPPDTGWKPGVTVNIGLKSGTNQISWHSLRISSATMLSMRGTGSTPSPIRQIALRQHQFGGTVGGPIKHDKDVFFPRL